MAAGEGRTPPHDDDTSGRDSQGTGRQSTQSTDRDVGSGYSERGGPAKDPAARGYTEERQAEERHAEERHADHVRLRDEAAAIGQLGDDLLAWFRDSLKLMGVEARLFLATLLLIVALAAMVGLLVAGAWLFLGAAAVLFLVREGGISPPMAALVGALVLTATAAGAYVWIRYLAREMGFVRTRASWAALFRGAGSADESSESGPESDRPSDQASKQTSRQTRHEEKQG